MYTYMSVIIIHMMCIVYFLVEGADPLAFPPGITRHPESMRLEYGMPAVLHCEALGDSLVYDW